MSKQSFESSQGMYHDGKYYVCTNGEWVQSDQAMDPSYSFEMSTEEQPERKPERRRMSGAAVVVLGSLAVGMLTIPPAVHYASESMTSLIINTANPAPDQMVTHDDLIGDIGVSLRKIMGGS